MASQQMATRMQDIKSYIIRIDEKLKFFRERNLGCATFGEPKSVETTNERTIIVWRNEIFPYELVLAIDKNGRTTYGGNFDDYIVIGVLN